MKQGNSSEKIIVARIYAQVHSRVRVKLVFCGSYTYKYSCLHGFVRSIFPLDWVGFAGPAIRKKSDYQCLTST